MRKRSPDENVKKNVARERKKTELENVKKRKHENVNKTPWAFSCKTKLCTQIFYMLSTPVREVVTEAFRPLGALDGVVTSPQTASEPKTAPENQINGVDVD